MLRNVCEMMADKIRQENPVLEESFKGVGHNHEAVHAELKRQL